MIGKAGTGSGFGGLTRYLLHGKDGQHENRAVWIESRNLGTDNTRIIPSIMRVTANQSEKCENPVYHLVIAFDEGDPLTPELEKQIADRTLKDMGLSEHQALYVRHNDTGRPHLHAMINRVHPETGIAWDNGHDYTRIEKSLRVQERELGFREVPGHHYAMEGQERPDRAGKLSSGQTQKMKRTGEVPFDHQVKGLIHKDVLEAESWKDLSARLAPHGLWTEKRGRGLVITDGENIVKGSSIDRKASLKGFEERLGAYEHIGRVEAKEQAKTDGRDEQRGGKAHEETSKAEALNVLHLKHFDETQEFQHRADRKREFLKEKQDKHYNRKGVEKELKDTEAKLSNAGFFDKVFKGRKLEKRIDTLKLNLANIKQREQEQTSSLESQIKTDEALLLHKQAKEKRNLEQYLSREANDNRQQQKSESRQQSQDKGRARTIPPPGYGRG